MKPSSTTDTVQRRGRKTAPAARHGRLTGIFGGSFNPIHCGHVALAKALLGQAGIEEVWLMVSPHNPLKDERGLLDDHRRLEMARLALQDEPHIKASDFEMGLPTPSYTWNTLQALRHRYPDRQFALIIGSDNWLVFDKWYRHDDLVRQFPIVVYPRREAAIDPSQLPRGVTLVEAPLHDVSSTEVRRRLQTGQSISGLVPDAVAEYIQRNQLYSGK